MAARTLVATKEERVFNVLLDRYVTIFVFYWDTGTVTWKV